VGDEGARPDRGRRVGPPPDLLPPRPAGAAGAIGISAFSNVLTGWAQGGPVAIHGTNEPWSIGRAVSNGCIRLPNPALRRLFRATPAGTPVVVHP
jgi:lipoprotein-anchoring transpeptidase ErfK/SrfK